MKLYIFDEDENGHEIEHKDIDAIKQYIEEKLKECDIGLGWRWL